MRKKERDNGAKHTTNEGGLNGNIDRRQRERGRERERERKREHRKRRQNSVSASVSMSTINERKVCDMISLLSSVQLGQDHSHRAPGESALIIINHFQ